MALKQRVLARKIEQRKSALIDLVILEEGFTQRSAELETNIDAAKTDDEITKVEQDIEALDVEQKESSDKKDKLSNEIEELETELEGLNKEAPKNTKEQPEETKTVHEGTDQRMAHNKYETRSQILARLQETEVREFYTKVTEASRNKRALTETDITIPEQVINMVQQRLGDYSNLYSEVTVQQLNGTARVIMDGAIPEAIWTEMCDPVEELATQFSQTELDGFKVGGFIPVCNALLEDSMINLANFIEERLAMAIAKALDKAILIGEGAASKQPQGVITALADETDRNVGSTGELANILGNIALIDDGEDGAAFGDVIAVMSRKTYYATLSPQTLLPTADGRLIVQNAQTPQLPDGTRIVFSQYAPANTIILGDFKKYLLGERSGVKLAASADVRFIQDQTVFKGTARYDGKPADLGAFVVITIDAA